MWQVDPALLRPGRLDKALYLPITSLPYTRLPLTSLPYTYSVSTGGHMGACMLHAATWGCLTKRSDWPFCRHSMNNLNRAERAVDSLGSWLWL